MPPDSPPILSGKHYDAVSVFTPENLLRESRRQNAIPLGSVPGICILDPDGDLLRYLMAGGRAHRNPYWACYHTNLFNCTHERVDYGVVGYVVGASFAVLVAEELFASGCRLLISITSAGQIVDLGRPPYFVLIEKALRDEGTSYHYLPPSPYSRISPVLADRLNSAYQDLPIPVRRGATWTTDAPFRETAAAIDRAVREGILAVEMEAAALYAFAQAKGKEVVCFAHVTNQMGNIDNDFEKGDAQGSLAALKLITLTAQAWLRYGTA